MDNTQLQTYIESEEFKASYIENLRNGKILVNIPEKDSIKERYVLLPIHWVKYSKDEKVRVTEIYKKLDIPIIEKIDRFFYLALLPEGLAIKPNGSGQDGNIELIFFNICKQEKILAQFYIYKSEAETSGWLNSFSIKM